LSNFGGLFYKPYNRYFLQVVPKAEDLKKSYFVMKQLFHIDLKFLLFHIDDKTKQSPKNTPNDKGDDNKHNHLSKDEWSNDQIRLNEMQT